MAVAQVIERRDFDALLDALARRGYTIIGPTVREQAIVYDEIRSVENLPVGWTDEQDAGRYRLRRREDEALFGYAVGPHSWKKYQLPPEVKLWQARVDEHGALTDMHESSRAAPRYAFLGARSCELHAAGILDRVLGRSEDAFIVAVQCGQAGGTCFCVSMNTGPVAEQGFDLALTEVLEGPRHYFAVEVGSERGAEVLADVPHGNAVDAERDQAAAVHARTASQMGRELDVSDIKELLYRNYEHPRWDEVADRCLTCGNCTMVCPTCFCTTVEDVTDLDGEHVERHQRWDSCFTVDYSHIHGGAVRGSARSRYRQWMTHKLATWQDQFGSSGCVGCGRCITWCPVGIDLTEEARAIRESEERPVRTLDQLIAQAPVFAGLEPTQLELLAGCARNEHVEAGTLLLREGDPADRFFLIRRGAVALEVHAPGRGSLVIETLHAGDVVGWSWLFAPYRWQLDGRAIQPCELVSFDGLCLRGKCETDHELGYQLMSRFAANLVERLQATRLQLLDVYGHAPAPA